MFISDIGPDQAFLYFLVKIFTLYICSFPNSANSFITNGLNSFSGKLFISVSLFFFQVFFFMLLQLRAVPLPFHFT